MPTSNKEIAEFNRFLESQTGYTLGKILDIYLNADVQEIKALVAKMKEARERKQ